MLGCSLGWTIVIVFAVTGVGYERAREACRGSVDMGAALGGGFGFLDGGPSSPPSSSVSDVLPPQCFQAHPEGISAYTQANLVALLQQLPAVLQYHPQLATFLPECPDSTVHFQEQA